MVGNQYTLAHHLIFPLTVCGQCAHQSWICWGEQQQKEQYSNNRNVNLESMDTLGSVARIRDLPKYKIS